MPNLTIFGVDIHPHYKLGDSKARRYALTILEDGKIAEQHREISLPQLLRLVKVRRPMFLAVDNIYELAQGINGLRNLFSTLPAETRVIQVTGFQESAETLQKIALRQGLAPPSRTSPIEEAEACARMAEKGVGAEVRVLEEETRILVCRNVSLGPGGSSQSRYRRGIHTSILSMAKEIEGTLKGAGLDFDLFTERSDFGLERAYFHVYAPVAKLCGLLKPMKGKYVSVKVRPVYRSRVEYVPMDKRGSLPTGKGVSERNLIIGVDPGTSCGLAILTLDGAPLYLRSRKDLTRGEVARIVVEFGKPAIVAADVVLAPGFVTRLAKMLDAVLFVPESILDVAEKREIVRVYAEKYSVKLKDSHVRDALAAAIKAFQHYRNKFEQTEGEVQKMGVPVSVDEVKALVVKGQAIRRAIELLSPKGSTEEKQVEPSSEKPALTDYEDKAGSQKAISFYREHIRQLKESNELLVEKEKALEVKVKNLENALELARKKEAWEIKREREYQRLQHEIETLRAQLTKEREEAQRLKERLEPLQTYRRLELEGDVVLLKPVETFTKNGLEKAFRLYNVARGDAILLLGSGGGGAPTAEEIARRGVKAVVGRTVISQQAEEVFEKYGIVVVPYDLLKVEWVEGYPYVKSEELDAAIKKMVELKKSEMSDTLRSIVEEYKKERAKDSK